MTDRPGVFLGIQTADCVPVMLVDPLRRAVAVLHAGWRGTAAAMAEEGVARMTQEYGTGARDAACRDWPVDRLLLLHGRRRGTVGVRRAILLRRRAFRRGSPGPVGGQPAPVTRRGRGCGQYYGDRRVYGLRGERVWPAKILLPPDRPRRGRTHDERDRRRELRPGLTWPGDDAGRSAASLRATWSSRPWG